MEEVKKKIREKKQTWKKLQKETNEINRVEYVEKRDRAKTAVKETKRRNWDNFGRELLA